MTPARRDVVMMIGASKSEREEGKGLGEDNASWLRLT
jgi:hypothetical protein